MFERFLGDDPRAWATKHFGSRDRVLFFSSVTIGNAIASIGLEYTTVVMYRERYAQADPQLAMVWEFMAGITAMGLACFILMFSLVPIWLAVALHRVVREPRGTEDEAAP